MTKGSTTKSAKAASKSAKAASTVTNVIPKAIPLPKGHHILSKIVKVLAPRAEVANPGFFNPVVPADKIHLETPQKVQRRKDLEAKCKQGAKKRFAEVVIIDPELAELMLERNIEENRSVSPGRDLVYTQQFKSGEFICTSQGLGFDSTGRMNDGRHRLTVCTETGIPFEQTVTYGLDPRSFLKIDNGQNKTGAQLMGIAGLTDGALMFGAARTYLQIETSDVRLPTGRYMSFGLNPKDSKDRLPKDLMVDFCASFPDFMAMEAHKKMYEDNPSIPSGTLLALHYLVRQKHPVLADDFFEKLCTGENLKRTDNVYKLREALYKKHIAKERVSKAWVSAWIIDCFNATKRGKVFSSNLKMVSGKDFPNVA